MKRLFTQFSFPGGIPSHVAPETPARSTRAASWAMPLACLRCRVRQSRPAGGLRHRRRRGRDRPAGDELALQQVPQSRHDGAVLPILHLNGHKIASPTVLARITRDELDACSAATATRRTSSKATIRARCTGDGGDARHGRCARSRRFSGRRVATALAAPALADDRAAITQGMDGPKKSTASMEGTSRAPGADRRARDQSGAPARARSTG